MNELLFIMLKDGYSVDYGTLSICGLKGMHPKWQVVCENYRYPQSMLYPYTDDGLKSAIRDFMNIKRGMEKDGTKHSKK